MKSFTNIKITSILKIIGGGLLLFLLFSISKKFNPGVNMSSINIPAILLTGLVTGGLTCLAVQGGLLAATIAQREEERIKGGLTESHKGLPIVAFLISKLIAYTILGFFLGWLGSFFQLSITTQIVLQILVALFMFATAMNILEVHPIFRYVVIQPPRFITKMVRKESKSQSMFAPAVLGAFTVFIPCGTTQAMMALAVASGNPGMGALILFTFILGTSPVFFALGYFTTRLGGGLKSNFMKVAAFVLIMLALFNIRSAFMLSGLSIYLPDLNFGKEKAIKNISNLPVEEATIELLEKGYSPSEITVKKNSLVKLKLVNTTGKGCIQAFTIPKLGVQKIVRTGSTEIIEFESPKEPGPLLFMCSMGMYLGRINVI